MRGYADAVYVNTHTGVVSLYVEGYLIVKQRFNGRKERRQIMKSWVKAFEFIDTKGKVYIDVSFYEMKYQTVRKPG
jgi:hypothetical protein